LEEGLDFETLANTVDVNNERGFTGGFKLSELIVVNRIVPRNAAPIASLARPLAIGWLATRVAAS
jgi:hypothetical protein